MVIIVETCGECPFSIIDNEWSASWCYIDQEYRRYTHKIPTFGRRKDCPLNSDIVTVKSSEKPISKIVQEQKLKWDINR